MRGGDDPSDKVEFRGADGDLLAGRLDRPAGRLRAFGLFAHCFTCSRTCSRPSIAAAASGLAVLRFDFTGLGNSAGIWQHQLLLQHRRPGRGPLSPCRHEAPRILIGHSLGGAPCARRRGSGMRRGRDPNAPFDPQHVQHLLADQLETIQRGASRR
jgi:putative redox protein